MPRQITRCLLVEDLDSDALLVVTHLEKAFGDRIAIVRAGCLEQACAALLETIQPFDVILLDLTLPDSSGVETLAAVQPYAAETPVVVLSGETGAQHVVRLQGAAEFVAKGDFQGVVSVLIATVQRSRQGRLDAAAVSERLSAMAAGIAEIRSGEASRTEKLDAVAEVVHGVRADLAVVGETIDGRDGVEQRLQGLELWRQEVGTVCQWVLRCCVGAAAAGACARLFGGGAADVP